MSTGTNDPAKCQWCGNFHAFKCPLVKSIEYSDNGLTKRVEFFAPSDYPKYGALEPGPMSQHFARKSRGNDW
jgi:hypothetical protein